MVAPIEYGLLEGTERDLEDILDSVEKFRLRLRTNSQILPESILSKLMELRYKAFLVSHKTVEKMIKMGGGRRKEDDEAAATAAVPGILAGWLSNFAIPLKRKEGGIPNVLVGPGRMFVSAQEIRLVSEGSNPLSIGGFYRFRLLALSGDEIVGLLFFPEPVGLISLGYFAGTRVRSGRTLIPYIFATNDRVVVLCREEEEEGKKKEPLLVGIGSRTAPGQP